MMSRRRILNITSTKKADHRLQVDHNGSGWVPTATFNLAGGMIHSMLYIPTAQTPMNTNNTVFPELDSYRTKDDVYMRGYKERISFNVTDGRCWTWRRITFTMKGDAILNGATAPADAPWVELSPQGYTRPFVNSSESLRNALYEYVFRGTQGRDWNSSLVASVDRDRVKIYSDVTRTINPGSTQGKRHTYNLWYPMNKTFKYVGDEAGTDRTQAHVSVNNRQGMGDYYIWDIIASSTTDAAAAGFSVAGTLYWHER